MLVGVCTNKMVCILFLQEAADSNLKKNYHFVSIGPFLFFQGFSLLSYMKNSVPKHTNRM